MDFFGTPMLSRIQLVMLFGMKLAAAAAVWLTFTTYYNGSDFFTYFSDSSTLIHNLFNEKQRSYSSAWTGSFDDSFFNSSRVMIILNSALHLFSFGNFYVHGLFFCFASFIGLTALLKALAVHFPLKKIIILPLFFIPSVVFWGSSPLKESLILLMVGLLIYYSDFGLKKNYPGKEFVVCLGLFIFLVLLKYYIVFALLPGFIVNRIVSYTSADGILLKYFCVFTASGILLWGMSYLGSDFNVLHLIADKQAKAISEAKGGVFLASEENFISVDYHKSQEILSLQGDGRYKINDGSSLLLWKQDNMADTFFIQNSRDTSGYKILYSVKPAGSVMEMKKIKPEPVSILLSLPRAFLNTLIHPKFTRISSWPHLAAAVENLWIFLIGICSVIFFDKKALEKKEILLFCLCFSIVVFVLVGFTTPAIGAMVRYRTTGLLFFTLFFALLIDEKRLGRKLSKDQ